MKPVNLLEAINWYVVETLLYVLRSSNRTDKRKPKYFIAAIKENALNECNYFEKNR